MSRVADALKVAGLGPAADLFRDDDHPWGGDLTTAAEVGDHAARLEPFEPAEPLRPAAAPPAADRPVSRSIVSPRPEADAATRLDPPRRAVLDDSLRPHLAALVERVFLPVSAEPTRSVAFTGLGTRSGVVTAMAAEILAEQTAATICLVDANFARPSLHEHFGLRNGMGLGDAIESGAPLSDTAREVRSNLWLLSVGTKVQCPSFASDSVRLRMAQFIASFDYVLVDAPISGAGDAAGIAPLVDGVILVLAADATRREVARRAAQLLQGVGAAVIGAVLTNRRFPIPEAVYRRL